MLDIQCDRGCVLVCVQVGQCFWRKNQRLVYLYPGKYEWAGSPAKGDCSLRIKAAIDPPRDTVTPHPALLTEGDGAV